MKKFALLIAALVMLAGCSAPTPTETRMPGDTEPVPGTGAPAETEEAPAPTEDVKVTLPDQLKDGDTTINVYVVDSEKIVQMPVDEYLQGVLAGEMDPTWPEEALKAQAVLARTYLVYYLSEKTSSYEGADISTDVAESQAYNAEGINDAVRAAVEDTAGQILVHDGKAIIAWFHACSGGQTALATEGLNYPQADPPYIVSVESDESDAPESARVWSASFTADEVRRAIEDAGVTAPQSLEPVKIAERGESGRAVTLTFGDTSVSAVELRKHLDPVVFRSTLLDSIDWEDGKLKVSGKGFGHGVGMSQWGAKIMADNGAGYEEIIAHYFKDVQLVTAWE